MIAATSGQRRERFEQRVLLDTPASTADEAIPSTLGRRWWGPGLVGRVMAVRAGAGQVDLNGALAVVVAAFLANTFESMLGATAQGRVEWLTNDLVNMLQVRVMLTTPHQDGHSIAAQQSHMCC